mgnify:FL=1
MFVFFLTYTRVQKTEPILDGEDKSWYERMREENVRANAAFLATLNMNDVSWMTSLKVLE